MWHPDAFPIELKHAATHRTDVRNLCLYAEDWCGNLIGGYGPAPLQPREIVRYENRDYQVDSIELLNREGHDGNYPDFCPPEKWFYRIECTLLKREDDGTISKEN